MLAVVLIGLVSLAQVADAPCTRINFHISLIPGLLVGGDHQVPGYEATSTCNLHVNIFISSLLVKRRVESFHIVT